jgi:hypothetical protein
MLGRRAQGQIPLELGGDNVGKIVATGATLMARLEAEIAALRTLHRGTSLENLTI